MHEFRPRIPLSRKWIVSIHVHAFERQNGWTSAIKWFEGIENENEWWTTVESRRSSCDTILSFLLDWFVALIITARKRSLRRLCFYRCLVCPRGGGHVWQGGMHGRGGMCGRGVCMAGGACMVEGMHGRRCAWQGARMPPRGYDEIRSMSGRYASYWNAFLFLLRPLLNPQFFAYV